MGRPAYVLQFTAWPTAQVSKGTIVGVDLLDRIYIIELDGRKWTVAQERVFGNPYDAEKERQIHEAFNQSCYEREEYDMLPPPLHGTKNNFAHNSHDSRAVWRSDLNA